MTGVPAVETDGLCKVAPALHGGRGSQPSGDVVGQSGAEWRPLSVAGQDRNDVSGRNWTGAPRGARSLAAGGSQTRWIPGALAVSVLGLCTPVGEQETNAR